MTPAVGLAALVGMAEGEGVVEMFFLGAMVGLVVCEVDWEVGIPFLGLVVVVDGIGSTQWLEVEVRGRSLTYASSSWLLPSDLGRERTPES